MDIKTMGVIRDIAGESLYKMLQAVYFPNQEDALVDWFYKPNKSMGGNSPYEVCERGDQNKLEDALMSTALGGSGL